MTCTFLADPLGKFFVNPDFRNPRQGIFKDCHFIAALSSLEWINSAYFPGIVKDPNSYTFFDDTPDRTKYPGGTDFSVLPKDVNVSINPAIFMDNLTGLYCGARSNNWTASVHETWPVLYEKAWAKFCLWKFKTLLSWDGLANSNTNPTYSSLPNGSDWGGNPVTVLKHLTKATPFSFSPLASSFTFAGCSKTDPYSFIRYCLCDSPTAIGKVLTGTFNGTITGCKTRYASGAWTYRDSAAARAKEITVTYSDSAIVADHCYSILGVYENSGIPYIVLRNPYGVADPSAFVQDQGVWNFYDKQFNLSGTSISGMPVTSFNLSSADGVFALKASQFRNYFEGFGFVKK